MHNAESLVHGKTKKRAETGMPSPEVTVGEATTKVEKSSVVFEGAQVPEGLLLAGNSAFVQGKIQLSPKPSWWKLAILKLMWIAVELYIFCVLVLCGQLLLDDRLPRNWRCSVHAALPLGFDHRPILLSTMLLQACF
jgi:hypothetical protein